MPYRKTPIAVGEIYHVFNRSIAKQPIFFSAKDYQRAIDVFNFYKYTNPVLRFSYYYRLTEEQKKKFLTNLISKHEPLVEIIGFCLMPNHIHFLLKNLKDGGISQFMRLSQNSYAKYFNTKRKRTGTLFQPMFKVVRIETEEQLVHVSRYIHLNPVTSYIIKPKDLKNYPWSSYLSYLNLEDDRLDKHIVLSSFSSIADYEKFVLDQVNYQQELDRIRHLLLEE